MLCTSPFVCSLVHLSVFISNFNVFILTLSLRDPSQRRVYKPSRRTRPFAATGYELANLAVESSQHASAIYVKTYVTYT